MVAGVVLVLVVVLAGVSASTGVAGALGLGFVSLLWLVVNGDMEGRVLIAFDPDHGLTAADLAGLAGLALAAWRLAAALRAAGPPDRHA